MALAFVKKQSQDRTTAAHIVASCGEVLGQLNDPDQRFTSGMLRATEWKELGHFFIYPKVLVARLRDPIRKPQRILWNYWAPYIAIITWTIAALLLVYWA